MKAIQKQPQIENKKQQNKSLGDADMLLQSIHSIWGNRETVLNVHGSAMF